MATARARSDGVNINLRAWEVAVLVHLRERLWAGDIWVERFRPIRTNRFNPNNFRFP
jgi:hypothetical protein